MEMMQIGVDPDQRPIVQQLYKVAQSNNVENFVVELNKVQASAGLPLQDIINEVSPSGNSLLHAAARSGSKDITGWLAEQFPHLIDRANHFGDTALHFAAKAGKAETIQVLPQFRTNPAASLRDVVPLVRIQNQEGNTALHEAVIHCNFTANYAEKERYHAVVACMVSVDSELAYVANNERKSPLYLAVETADLKILRCLLEYLLPAATDRQQQPDGKSPVHAAIHPKKLDMLKEMLNRRPELINLKDGNSWNALHCAAFVGNLEAIDFLLQKHPKGIYERDNEGLYPLHVACESGYIKAFDKLFHEWPDTSEFLDNKCQNILHVAAKNGRDYLVRHILKDPKLVPELVNAKDIEGNTPLHLAALHGHSLVVGTLLLTRKCDSQILNKKGLTAYEVAKERAGPPVDYGKQMEQHNVQCEDVSSKHTKRPDSTDSMMTLSILFLLQLFQISCGHRQQQRMRRLRHEMKIKRANKEDIKDRITGLLVVATLIAGIAFQAAVQLPEGSKAEDEIFKSISSAPAPAPAPAPALALAKKLAASAPTPSQLPSWFENFVAEKLESTYLGIFTFFDLLSMNLAIFAAITLCWVQLLDVNFASFFVWKSSILVGAALYSICIAFGFAMLIGIKDFGPTYASVMIVLEALFILVLTVFISPLVIPFGLKHVFVRGLYVALFIAYFIVHRLLDCCLCRLLRKA